jgi:phenylpyruvate tautomerase PptA (4-oxalocrotonate tautomerase family)
MEYAPEAIAQLVQQVTQVFKATLEHQLAASPTAVTIADVEKGMRGLLR